MAGTKESARRAAETNKAKYGPDYYAKIGAIGGKNGNTGGFTDPVLAKRASVKGLEAQRLKKARGNYA